MAARDPRAATLAIIGELRRLLNRGSIRSLQKLQEAMIDKRRAGHPFPGGGCEIQFWPDTGQNRVGRNVGSDKSAREKY